MIHLICGPSGAGKTTHALKIANERHAIPLFIDEYLKQHISFPSAPNLGYIYGVLGPKFEKCGSEIIRRSEEFLAVGKEVVLDIGVFRRDWRNKVYAWAKNKNYPVRLYYIYASQAVRKKRILERNNHEKQKTYSLHVPEWVFDMSEVLFEPPMEDENPVIISNEANTA